MIYDICKIDRKNFVCYYFGVNVQCWCPFVHLFDTPFQNSPTAMCFSLFLWRTQK